jgi:hypothetical protein
MNTAFAPAATPGMRDRRARAALAMAAMLAASILPGLLGGCAMRSPAHAAGSSGPLPETAARMAVAQWQQQLSEHVSRAGGGDPAVLSQLPVLRSRTAMRPGQIVFGVRDVDAFVPERDGYDVFGLLLGKVEAASGPAYVFIVGTVERGDYRSLSIADIRLAALSVNKGGMSWATGTSDAAALAAYRRAADTTTAVRFPADSDRFRLVSCAPAVCAEDAASGARWSLYFPAPAQ